MKKAYLKTFQEADERTMIAINIDVHEGHLFPMSMNDGEIMEVKNNLLEDESLTLEEKRLVVRGSTDLITIQKFYRKTTKENIYLFKEQQNKLTINGGITRIFIKEVEVR